MMIVQQQNPKRFGHMSISCNEMYKSNSLSLGSFRTSVIQVFHADITMQHFNMKNKMMYKM